MSPAEVTLGLLEPFGHGRGYPDPLGLPQPAAGADLSYKVTGFYWERIAALSFRLVTDANAANRGVNLAILDGDGVTVAVIPSAAVQVASLTRTYCYLPNASAPAGPLNGVYLAPAPSIFLLPTWRIVTSIAAKQAGDQLSNVRLYRERFPTGPDGYPMGRVETRPAARREFEPVA